MLQYIPQIQQKTPLQTKSLVLDLTTDFLWVQCDNGTYKYSSYHPVRCNTNVCTTAESIAWGDCFGPPAPDCNNNTCDVFPENTITWTITSGHLSQDVVASYSTDDKKLGPQSQSPQIRLLLRARLSSERTSQRSNRHGKIEKGLLRSAYSTVCRLRLQLQIRPLPSKHMKQYPWSPFLWQRTLLIPSRDRRLLTPLLHSSAEKYPI